MWKNYARIRHGIHDNIIQRMRVGCWLDISRTTHSQYVEHIRFPHQQQLHIPTTMSFL